MTVFEKARNYLYRNATPLQLAKWKYFFENGSEADILTALASYQNEDGGFGHGLEADCFNPNSSPIQTWAATETLGMIMFKDSSHPIVKGILKYLESGSDFDSDKMQWRNTVPTNNDYPHAIWWEYSEGDGEFKYNPTAALAGFILIFADKESALYQKGCEIVKSAANWFFENFPVTEQHVLGCFAALFNMCFIAGKTDLFDMQRMGKQLLASVKKCVCCDPEEWGKAYMAVPQDFVMSRESPFYSVLGEAAEKYADFLLDSQLEDGSFPVNWQWYNDYREFEVSKVRWKCEFIIKNMLFLRNFGKL